MGGQPRNEAPGDRRRHAILIFILLFLVVQIALPVSYYGRRDRYDERFAWRMFSVERMVQCRPGFRVADKPVRLGESFHEGWVTIARRGRRNVLEAMAARLCEKNPGKAVTLELTCNTVDGRTEQPSVGVWDLCERGHL